MIKIKILMLITSVLSLASCSENKIVLNNAFVYLIEENQVKTGYFSLSCNGENLEYSFQSVLVGEYSLPVTAMVNSKGEEKGYRFLRWSDGNLNQTRKDLGVSSNDKPVVVYAIFSKEI